MVCLHTATMGVHPACFFTDRVEKDATLARNRAGKQSSYLVHSSLYCAPTGERQEKLWTSNSVRPMVTIVFSNAFCGFRLTRNLLMQHDEQHDMIHLSLPEQLAGLRDAF